MSERNGDVPGRSAAVANRPRITSLRQRTLLSIAARVDRPISTTDLAGLLGESLGATAHHVRALVRGGHLDWAGERRARGALQTFYTVSGEGHSALRLSTAVLMRELFGVIVRSDGSVTFPRFDTQAIDELTEVVDALRSRYDDIAERALIRLEQDDAT